MSESITLPRSGIVLHKGYAAAYVARGAPDIRLLLNSMPGGSCPVAWCRNDSGHTFTSDDECIAWLDERVLALRSALLPPDAKQRIFNAVIAQNGTMLLDDELNAVLAALGVDHA